MFAEQLVLQGELDQCFRFLEFELGGLSFLTKAFWDWKALPFASFQIFYKYFQSFNVFPSSVNDLSIFSFEAPWRHGLTPKKMVNTWTSLISALAGQLGPLFHHPKSTLSISTCLRNWYYQDEVPFEPTLTSQDQNNRGRRRGDCWDCFGALSKCL